jgi:hypothetical protein
LLLFFKLYHIEKFDLEALMLEMFSISSVQRLRAVVLLRLAADHERDGTEPLSWLNEFNDYLKPIQEARRCQEP